jgi:oligopeptidase A
MTTTNPPPEHNPLLDFSGLPRFAEIRPGHIGPAVERLIGEAETALEQATSDATPAEYDALSAVLDVANERLSRAWGTVNHLNGVADTPELRAAYTEYLPKVVEFHTRLGADERLYAKYKAVQASASAATLIPARKKALANALRDFVLSGAALEGAAKARFAEVQERLAECAQKFSEHVLDATDAFSYLATEDELAGVPDSDREAMRAAAAAAGQQGYRITLHLPSYLPVMQHGAHRPLRERLYRAYVTRASEFGPAELDNAGLMRELLQLRQEEAELLGYRNHAEVSLVPKMADTPEQVVAFLNDLGHRARPGGERDLAELREFARAELGLAELEAWDIPFASERLKERRYSFSDDEVRQYFTEPKVLEGLFAIVETLFEVAIRPDEAPVWHPTARFFRCRAAQRPEAGRLVAQFYLDPYARSGKRPGAWMADARDRWLRPEGELQTPVAVPRVQLRGRRSRASLHCSPTAKSRRSSRVRPWPADDADAGRRPRRLGHLGCRVGRRSSCRASSWRTSAGSGKSSSG